MTFFLTIGIFIGWFVPQGVATLLSAKYSRSSMDKIMAELLGGWTFKNVYPHELLVVSYEYN